MTESNTSHGGERKQKRTETVWRLYNEGWAAGNFDPMLEILDPGVVWTAIEDAPDAGTYRGYDGVRAYWQDWLDAERILEVNEYATWGEALEALRSPSASS